MTHSNSSNLNVKDLSFINDIKSMAVIGPSEKRNFFFLRNHQDSFKGKVYAIHPRSEEIPGFPKEDIYASILDVPGEVDFAFIAVPPKLVLHVMNECVKKGVKLVTIFTSEFSDAGTEEGKALEQELLKRAQNEVRILGPNGLGLFYPKIGLAWRQHFPTTPGSIGFIAQSGGICNIAIYSSIELGIEFSKVFSFGNGADLDFVDLLYFLINDSETDIILCYIEGIKQGRINDLIAILNNNKKPIIVLKGGKSETGIKAAKTHTASVSGDRVIWQTFFKQYNVIEVDSLEQLLHTARLIACYGIFDAKNLAVLSISGGYGVVLVDIIEKYGLKVPPFPLTTQNEINKKLFMPGTSSNNPLDFAAQFFAIDSVKEIIDIVLSDKSIDGLILDLPGFYLSFPPRIQDLSTFYNTISECLNLGHIHKKPLIVITQYLTRLNSIHDFLLKVKQRNVPLFGDPLEFIPLLPKISNYFIKSSK
ncbi:MAG: hypothetical protein EAX91_14520 [Candidatus Lokiarchaeota archaeon]|nr:hypothetical protein [Candidatus Lokiarchaeota archaeon]